MSLKFSQQFVTFKAHCGRFSIMFFYVILLHYNLRINQNFIHGFQIAYTLFQSINIPKTGNEKVARIPLLHCKSYFACRQHFLVTACNWKRDISLFLSAFLLWWCLGYKHILSLVFHMICWWIILTVDNGHSNGNLFMGGFEAAFHKNLKYYYYVRKCNHIC